MENYAGIKGLYVLSWKMLQDTQLGKKITRLKCITWAHLLKIHICVYLYVFECAYTEH